MKTEHFHNTPQETYERLVELFGEKQGETRPDIKWVDFGAGNAILCFFPQHPETSSEEAEA